MACGEVVLLLNFGSEHDTEAELTRKGCSVFFSENSTSGEGREGGREGERRRSCAAMRYCCVLVIWKIWCMGGGRGRGG